MASTTKFEIRSLGALKPNSRNLRNHPKKQINQIARSIKEFGAINPIIVDEDDVVLAGHGRLEAARSLGMASIPTVKVEGLTDVEKRLYMLADNKTTDNSTFDRDRLGAEFTELLTIEGLDLSSTAFLPVEIDSLISDYEDSSCDPADACPDVKAVAVSKKGDLWRLGNHRLLCGDARNPDDLHKLCGAERAAMAFIDPPYNVRVAGIVGRGKIKHEEFAMASGEMDDAEFRAFLTTTLANAADMSAEGAVHFVCSDWRHIEDGLAVGKKVYGQTLNVIVWEKSNAGQGSFYRSGHEMIACHRVGEAPHLNNIELGRHGRNRSNVWHYAGVNAFGKGRLDDLAAHPTVKPVAMVADAIKDCTRRGDIVLDTFAGSGTTGLACERVGRRARLIEYEPGYVDVAIRRWQDFTGKDAIHAETGLTFDQTADEIGGEA